MCQQFEFRFFVKFKITENTWLPFCVIFHINSVVKSIQCADLLHKEHCCFSCECEVTVISLVYLRIDCLGNYRLLRTSVRLIDILGT